MDDITFHELRINYHLKLEDLKGVKVYILCIVYCMYM